jgi:hypothetical protein
VWGWGKYDQNILNIDVKIAKWNPLKTVKKGGGRKVDIRESNRRGEFDQSTLHAGVGISKWYLFIKLV